MVSRNFTDLNEFVDAGVEGNQAFSGNFGGRLHERFSYVANLVLMQEQVVEPSGFNIRTFGRMALNYVLKVDAHE